MKVGLIRHFRVIHSYRLFKLMTSREFEDWQYGYDTAETKRNPIEIDKSEWQICYSSDLKRAVYTARTVYGDNIIKTKLLREVEIIPSLKTNVKLPFLFWTILGRFEWYFCHKHVDEKRAYDFICSILNEDGKNVLIVSHGAIMWYLRKALLLKGFKGPRFGKAKNGYLYVFEK